MPRHIKVLIVVPENNTTMEPEISALCPALAPISVARVKRPARTLLLEDLPTYAEATLGAIEPFAAEPLDLVIHGCTAAGFLGGPGGNARMVERLRERTRATVVSTAGAMTDALRSAGVSATAVVKAITSCRTSASISWMRCKSKSARLRMALAASFGTMPASARVSVAATSTVSQVRKRFSSLQMRPISGRV